MRHTTRYDIGTKVWHAGDELTITTNPYELYGAFWQDGQNDAGKVVTIRIYI